MRIDADKIIAETDIQTIVATRVKLKKVGSVYRGLCPFHNENTPSFEVVPRKNMYKCMGCGKGGDVIDFVMSFDNVDFKEACRRISNGEVPTLPYSLDGSQPHTKKETAPDWVAIVPVPADAPEPSFHHYKHGEPSKIWAYRNERGELLAYTVRYDLGQGKKEILPFTFCKGKDTRSWRFQGLPTPRSLYGLERLAAKPAAPVIIVEGEKTADALQATVDTAVVVSWIGGANGVALADFSPLKGRRVMIWPDNDWQGISAAIQVGTMVRPLASSLQLISNPTDATEGWDFADAGWDTPTAKQWINSNRYELPAPTPCPLQDAPPHEAYWLIRNPVTGQDARHLFMRDGRFFGQKVEEPAPPAAPPAPEPTPPPAELAPVRPSFSETKITVEYHGDAGHDDMYDDMPPMPPIPPEFDTPGAVDPRENVPFSVLGFEKMDLGKIAYVFFDKLKRVVIRREAGALSKSSLLELADLSFWEDMFPGTRTTRINEDAAKNYLIRTATVKGLFTSQRIRGRGAWIDNGRVVVHAGSNLIVNGARVELGSMDSRFIYEVSNPLNLSPDNPISTKEANSLITFLEKLSWERKVNARLMAGWCVIAPVCGALKWRPHIWLTGAAGSGKSWIYKNVLKELLGETALSVQGDTSSAGLRQTLGMDAIPVVFDEAEPHDPKANERIQDVLSLMRSASTADSGEIIKGTAGHSAKSFRINSCFAMVSISVAVDKKSDRSRVTILGLTNKHMMKEKELHEEWAKTITPDFVKGLQARTLNMLPVILQNATVFAQAAAAVLGEQRIGDQLGALLAGAYSLYSPNVVTYEMAKKWVEEQQWTEERELDESSDENALLMFLYNQILKVQGAAYSYERSLTEVIEIAAGRKVEEDGLSQWHATEYLARIGIKTTHSSLIISNSHEPIKKMLEKTPWAKNHHKILLRLPGAKNLGVTKFAGRVSARAVEIPYVTMS